MSLTVRTDRITGPRVSRKSRTAEFDYQVESDVAGDGPTLAEDIETAILGAAPADYRGWPLEDITVGPEGNSDRVFAVTVKYAASGGGLRPETGDQVESWSTGGGTKHIKVAKQTVAYSAGAPDQEGAINVADGKIEGVDAVEATWGETVTVYVANADIAAVKTAAYAATGTVNDDTWRGFAAGEVLLVEVSGQKRSEGDWEVTYRFAASPNRTSVSVADGAFTIATLEGWHYVWVLWRETVDTNKTKMAPVAYYVVRLYDYSDFDLLDLE